jgi:hypothetical protein
MKSCLVLVLIAICAADIQSAYVQVPTSEKHYIICGPEFSPDLEGSSSIITNVLYGGKSAGSDYWKHMHACMIKLNFVSCHGEPGVWQHPAIKPDGTPYYTYICLYIDGCLCIDIFPQDIVTKEIGKFWTHKKNSVGPPSIYLGNKVTKITLENDVTYWVFSSS